MEGITVTPKEVAVEPGQLPPEEHVSPISNFLGVDTQDPKVTEQLNYVYAELRGDTKEYNPGDLLHKLRSIEQRLGAPALGESRLGKVYNYFRANEQVRKAEKLRDAYLR